MADSQASRSVTSTSSQWPGDLPQLKMLNDQLLCPVCYDYMRNPVISTTCSHNYCSLCVRKFISLKTSCPVCYNTLTDASLKPNRVLEEVISCFKPVKDYVLRVKQLNHPAITTVPAVSEILPTRRAEEVQQASCSKEPEEQPTPKAKGDQVPCPICRSFVKQSLINSHLDKCLANGGGPPTAPPKRKPLPKWIYSLMKDGELKKKLKELGLSATGDRNTLINRHRQYTILYNAECDAVSPRSVEELRAAFEQEEAASRSISSSRSAAAASTTKSQSQIEEENRRYLAANKAAYDDLINQIKTRAAGQTTVKSEPERKEEKSQMEDEEDEILILPTPEKIIEEVTLPGSSDEEETDDQAVGSSTPGKASGNDNEVIHRPSSSPCYSPIASESASSSDFDVPSPPDSPELTSIAEAEAADDSSTNSSSRKRKPFQSDLDDSSSSSSNSQNASLSKRSRPAPGRPPSSSSSSDDFVVDKPVADPPRRSLRCKSNHQKEVAKF